MYYFYSKREHDLKNIKEIEIGETEEFDGYEDDELKDELKHYYGKEVGKISADNPNTITFKLNFNDYNEKVLIKKVYNEDKSLSFEIVDNPNHKKSVEQAKDQGATIIEIDGTKFMLFEGKAYKIDSN